MEQIVLDSFDVVVIGAGHAGCEAGLASARLGKKTGVFTISLDAIANLPCNPCIGGTAKGHLVREIDALGGEMGKAADATFIQSRMLNKGKGPAVHSLRVQIDRPAYKNYMKKAMEEQENLYLKQQEVVDILVEEGEAVGVVTRLGAVYYAKKIILCTGTFLEATIHVGYNNYQSGPDGLQAALGLSEALKEKGVDIKRFKTGTPARVHKRSIRYEEVEVQPGDEEIEPFSFTTKGELKNQVDCYITYTNAETHKVILDNIKRSAMYSGNIEGTGTRYCPSIEDKIVRFADKDRHQAFIEPCGLDTQEIYLQGLSSSLPQDVQLAFYKTMDGLGDVEIMRDAYAIEYDCINPIDLLPSLEFKAIANLYGAGQFNGTSGYEEAAAQGIVAGINAARAVDGQAPLILDRASSYVGTLIDDLVTKGVNDPYRMMTSRSEYRLLLRQDNADERLTPIGHEVGLISEKRNQAFLEKYEAIDKEEKRLLSIVIAPSEEVNTLLKSLGTTPLKTGIRLGDLIKRPQISYQNTAPLDKGRKELSKAVWQEVEIRLKYEGYIKRQLLQVEQMRKLEKMKLDPEFDYNQIDGLRLEAREKLKKVKPLNIGQASRISGVSPADVSVLLIWLSSRQDKE